MKRLLSILASVGLVATASSSVVSCVKKDTTPTYNSISDIKGWSLLNDNQALTKNDLKDPTNFQWHVIATIANQFKNPESLLKEWKNNPLLIGIGIQGPEQVTSRSEYINVQLEKYNNSKYKDVVATSGLLTMKILNEYTEFDTGHCLPFQIDISDDASSMISTLRIIANDLKNVSPDNLEKYINLEKASATMMNMDLSLYSSLANAQPNKVPGFDNSSFGYRYDSIQQQLMMSFSDKDKLSQKDDKLSAWNSKMQSFNEALLRDLNGLIIAGRNDSTKGLTLVNIQNIVKSNLSKLSPKDKSYFITNPGENK